MSACARAGEVMGSGPDGLATGLLCVDNITLIEHIGNYKHVLVTVRVENVPTSSF